MDESIGKLTVYFDDPFWVGVFEHIRYSWFVKCAMGRFA